MTYLEDAKCITVRGGSQVLRREIQLTDDSMDIVSMYVWGKAANELDLKQFDIIVLHGIKVGEFNQEITLTYGEGSQVIKDMSGPEVNDLQMFLEEKMNK